ncbi:MAG: hypothetical protein CVU91_13350 [Firmicutes bacterium HGW-Firmicutes-16]|nr:MAG: hypothetical protein CVU91_13350 [Firmicutes bacterium HGW-Firmicutes-16]
MKEPRDRSAEVMVASGRLEVWCHDFCDAFEQDAGRLFSCRECWYCKYGSFGIYSENPTKTGICRYPEHKKTL